MALLKYFVPSKMFNVCVHIHKHIACLWVWLHLPGLSLKIKTQNIQSDQFPLYGKRPSST